MRFDTTISNYKHCSLHYFQIRQEYDYVFQLWKNIYIYFISLGKGIHIFLTQPKGMFYNIFLNPTGVQCSCIARPMSALILYTLRAQCTDSAVSLCVKYSIHSKITEALIKQNYFMKNTVKVGT